MSDVIKDAKQLLDGATPAPWEHYNDHGIVSLTSGDTPIATDLNTWDADLIAAAPELAQALAEETYEYAVQVKRGDGWEYTYESWDNRWQGSYSVQEVRAQRDHPGEETRIVRRRISPPEVINE